MRGRRPVHRPRFPFVPAPRCLYAEPAAALRTAARLGGLVRRLPLKTCRSAHWTGRVVRGLGGWRPSHTKPCSCPDRSSDNCVLSGGGAVCNATPMAARPWLREETGYQRIQGTKPQTLAYGLTDSPAGLAAWMVEEFRSWSDCGGDIHLAINRDRTLGGICLYGFTGAIGSSFWPYYARMHGPWHVPAVGTVDVRCVIAPSPRRSAGRPGWWRAASSQTSSADRIAQRRPFRGDGAAGGAGRGNPGRPFRALIAAANAFRRDIRTRTRDTGPADDHVRGLHFPGEGRAKAGVRGATEAVDAWVPDSAGKVGNLSRPERGFGMSPPARLSASLPLSARADMSRSPMCGRRTERSGSSPTPFGAAAADLTLSPKSRSSRWHARRQDNREPHPPRTLLPVSRAGITLWAALAGYRVQVRERRGGQPVAQSRLRIEGRARPLRAPPMNSAASHQLRSELRSG